MYYFTGARPKNPSILKWKRNLYSKESKKRIHLVKTTNEANLPKQIHLKSRWYSGVSVFSSAFWVHMKYA